GWGAGILARGGGGVAPAWWAVGIIDRRPGVGRIDRAAIRPSVRGIIVGGGIRAVALVARVAVALPGLLCQPERSAEQTGQAYEQCGGQRRISRRHGINLQIAPSSNGRPTCPQSP